MSDVPGEPPQIRWTRVELICVLRHLRPARDAIWHDLMALQEQRRVLGVEGGSTDGAIRTLATEMAILDAITRKCWGALVRRHR